jgi:tetratricopeptide (TPR) repeat protein/DNA-binding XRE family transcriptional regulator
MPARATSKAARRQGLVQRRKALGLTQEDLAELLAVERTTVVRWERGQSEPLPWLRPKLARALRVSDKQLEALLAGPEHSGLAGTGVPRQLPAAVADFTGRAAELTALTETLDSCADNGAPGAVVISAIGGMAGVGKTALAVYWAHQAADRFPDGQLYVNLRGFDPGGTPATPAEVIRGFMDALGIAPGRVPASPEAQMGLYRSLLSERQMLIVLDNARDEQQVRPLLPASPGTLVLVTSRNQLAGLAATGGARLLSLDVLAQDEATRLLSTRIGQAGAADEPGALAEIAILCGRLPLALAVAAARAAIQPGLPLATLVADLRETPARLDALDSGEPAASVRAVFSWSYQQLSPNAARMFRLLGLHPGPDITAPAAASLAAIPLSQARQHLAGLASVHLMAEHLPGRYVLHDLLRAYAADLAAAIDPEEVQRAALARTLDHYLHTAHTAALLLSPTRDAIALAPAQSGVTPESLADDRRALAWFEGEHHVLRSAAVLAGDLGFDVHAWQLPWAMTNFLDWRGHWDEQATLHRAALAAAIRLGDKSAQAATRRMLAYSCARRANYDEAGSHLGECLTLYRQLRDRTGEAKTHQTLSWVAEHQQRFADALAHGEHALELFNATNDRPSQAAALNNVGIFHAALGNYEQARTFCQQALSIHHELGFRPGEAASWDSLGCAEHQLGRFGAAVACFQQALGIVRDLADRFSESEILMHLGDTRHASGKPEQAREAWLQALDILDDLQHPNAEQVRAKLVNIGGQAAPTLTENG